jgi:hypothetical protein
MPTISPTEGDPGNVMVIAADVVSTKKPVPVVIDVLADLIELSQVRLHHLLKNQKPRLLILKILYHHFHLIVKVVPVLF